MVMSIYLHGEMNTFTKMRKFTKYILLMLCLVVGCQRVELVDPSPMPQIPEVSGEATVNFSVTLTGGMPQTKAMGESPVTDIENLYLIIFDSNGYFVESRLAEISGRNDNKANFKVTLTMTNQKRIIHFIANCPISQVEYGHENEVISRLYVKKGESIETAYWHRLEVPYIIVDDDGNMVDANSQILANDANPFHEVPLLRNYTQITVEDNHDDDDNFHLLSYAVYNTIDVGTVAPYNKSKAEFQMFGRDGLLFSYDRLIADGFEGHVLSSAELDTDVTENDFMSPGSTYYMYERKVSVRPGVDESEWYESPTHIILKGVYTGKGYEDNTTPTYYKVDLIREVNNSYQYYNLLRNFDYTFRLRSVTGIGYKTIAQAMANPAGNNLAGSTHTQKLTDVSDGTGRIMVSYTDTTLVSNHDIEFKFKFIPDITNQEAMNRQVSLIGDLDGTGNVLKGLKYTIDYGEKDPNGWATVTFRVNDPSDIAQVQKIVLNAGDNPNLQKTITFTLKKPYTLEIICYDRSHKNQTVAEPDNVIDRGIGQQLGVYFRIPDDLTPDMFPLQFKIEADKLSISPDVTGGNTVPVVSGASIIPGKTAPAFHYLFTIETYEIYQSIPNEEGTTHKKLAITRWLTNMVESASYVVADNKYFNIAASYFRNSETQTEEQVLGHKRRYTDLRVDPNPVFYGVGESVKIMFDLDSREQKFLPKTVRVKLEGMECTKHRDTEFDVYLTADPNDPDISTLHEHTKVVVMQPGSRSVIVDGLRTTVTNHSDQYDNKGTEDSNDDTGPIRFTLNPEQPSEGGTYDTGYYEVSSDVAKRIAPAFTMLSISPNPVLTGTGIPVTLKFLMDADDDSYFNRTVIVKLNGLEDKDTRATEVRVTPTEGSLKVQLDNLVTSSVDGNVSFSLSTEDGQYKERTSETITRRSAEFWGLGINPTKVPQGKEKKLSISFNMDEDDEHFGDRSITVTLIGMKYMAPSIISEYPDGLTQLTFTPKQYRNPPTRYMTIGDLVTTTEGENVGFIITAPGYGEKTVSTTRSAVEFKNLMFTRNGDVVERINVGETVEFNFNMTYFEPGMTVDVSLDGFEPYDMPTAGDGSLVEAATRAARSYVFTPYEKNCKLQLRAVETESSSYSVTLAAASYGYQSKSAGISKARYSFNAVANPTTISGTGNSKITFHIPSEAWATGQTTMPVNITLDRLEPADNNKLQGSNGSYVYNVTKNNNNSYEFIVKTTQTTAGICYVTLEAPYFHSQSVPITQTVPHALMAKNSNSTNSSAVYDSQAVYQLATPLTRGQRYTLTFYVRADANVDNFGVFLKMTSDDGKQQEFDIGNVTTQWTRKTIDINTATNAYDMIAFNIGKVLPTNAIYFDDVSLVRSGQSEELIKNGDFEDPSPDNWDFTSYHADDWWVKVNTGAATVLQCSLKIVDSGRTK